MRDMRKKVASTTTMMFSSNEDSKYNPAWINREKFMDMRFDLWGGFKCTRQQFAAQERIGVVLSIWKEWECIVGFTLTAKLLLEG